MRALVAAIVALCLVGVVVLALAGDTTAGKAAGLSLLGVASVLAVSAVFLAVGRSEDEDRAAAAPPPPKPKSKPEPDPDPHPRPALDRRRPLPPRRPS